MNVGKAERRSVTVGMGSLSLGAGLLIRPARLGSVTGLGAREVRVIAACDTV